MTVIKPSPRVGRPPIPVNKQIKIRELRADGFSYREIAKKVGVSHETCRKYSHDVEVEEN